MVFDDVRNRLYVEALKKIITPDSVVLDLGAGLGIHGLSAAAMGARKVYLVEPEPVVRLAMEVARLNEVADRVVVLEGKIEDLKLPESVDVIVSVFTGNLLFSEDLLPSLFHARDQYLKPGGHLVPDLAELVIVPVAAPELHSKHIERWARPSMTLDFSPVRRFAANEVMSLRREDASMQRLTDEVAITSIDMRTAQNADCLAEASCEVKVPGLCHGLLCWIRIRLDNQWLSTDPAGAEVHWSPTMLPLDPPMPLRKGESIKVAVQRPTHGDWTWSITAAAGSQRHSSFLARVENPRRMLRMMPTHRPGLDKTGQDTLQTLAMMQAGSNNLEIAQFLVAEGQSVFRSTDDALDFVRHLAVRYGLD